MRTLSEAERVAVCLGFDLSARTPSHWGRAAHQSGKSHCFPRNKGPARPAGGQRRPVSRCGCRPGSTVLSSGSFHQLPCANVNIHVPGCHLLALYSRPGPGGEEAELISPDLLVADRAGGGRSGGNKHCLLDTRGWHNRGDGFEVEGHQKQIKHFRAKCTSSDVTDESQ